MALHPDEIRPLLDSLLELWTREPGGVTTKSESSEHLPVVFGLAAHAHRLAAAALRLYDGGLPFEAVPLIRTAYETALTAMWVAQVDDALPALLNKELKQRRKLAANLSRARWSLTPEDIARIGRDGYDLRETTSNGVAGSFEQLCRDLTPGGIEAYGLYRFMSAYTHPTVSVIDEYLVQREEGAWPPIGLSYHSKTEDWNLWLFFLAASLVWSGRAFDFYDRSHKRRNELRRAARALEIPPKLNLSDAAWQRLHKPH